ncbi:MAG: two-component sensor histidine kinase [Blastopirellula sp.]|nr:MAG: two-component sensor histidine kinase [Blastopirellula sp.]
MDTATNDISTDEPSLEDQVKILRQRLIEAQKLTALGELLGTTTHEFNNVLMSVINYAKMGLRHKDEATRTKCLDKILAAGNRAAKITTGILGMAKNRGNRLEPTDLSTIIADCMTLLEKELSRYRISVELKIAEVPEAIANGNQIQQVLMNLMINARQAMPKGGQLIIKLSHSAKEGMIDIMVRDSGSGIPADQLPKIFDPYFSTKSGPDESGKGGTGLGLSACRDIIEAHQGKIRVQSSLGVGTAFTIRIPVVKANLAPKPRVLPVQGVHASVAPSAVSHS